MYSFDIFSCADYFSVVCWKTTDFFFLNWGSTVISNCVTTVSMKRMLYFYSVESIASKSVWWI